MFALGVSADAVAPGIAGGPGGGEGCVAPSSSACFGPGLRFSFRYLFIHLGQVVFPNLHPEPFTDFLL